MAFGLLTVGGGYGQLGFVGPDGIILADASTLTVTASGSISSPIASPCLAGMVSSTTLLGISSPTAAFPNGFCFTYEGSTNTFSTFVLPSSFNNSSTLYDFYPVNQDGNITNLWVAAGSSSENSAYPYLLNLSTISGLTTGTSIVDTLDQYYWNHQATGGYFIVGDYIGNFSAAVSTTSLYNISTGVFSYYNTYITPSATPRSTVFGANIAYVDNSGNIQLTNTSGSSLFTIRENTFSTIATTNPLLYNYLGTLMYVNPSANLACSMDLSTGYVSPIFSFAINPNAGTVAYDAFDQPTGTMYLNTGGSSPNTFGDLAPMLLT